MTRRAGWAAAVAGALLLAGCTSTPPAAPDPGALEGAGAFGAVALAPEDPGVVAALAWARGHLAATLPDAAVEGVTAAWRGPARVWAACGLGDTEAPLLVLAVRADLGAYVPGADHYVVASDGATITESFVAGGPGAFAAPTSWCDSGA